MSSMALRTIDDEWYQSVNPVNELVRSSIKPVVVTRPQLSSPSVVHRSSWARPTVDRLIAIAPLRDNWDQRGSAAVRADVLSFAWQLLVQIMPEDGAAPVAVPLGNGGIQLEWSSNRGDLEIEIARPFEISALFFQQRNGDEVEIPIQTETWDQLAEVIRENFRS
ncbi:hypothetical protein [Bradyrhizobium sp.]|uniref:hypothetical protein n=1 Tax=Bradyrhizobium sp. TaxID=376 RepID=UPI001D5C7454|nr:hypothetical protein [Bradyrhizobium sp.]MBI5319804.1 hypothetical protein [Bradyrhizobium sp.]